MSFFDKLQFASFAWAFVLYILAMGFEKKELIVASAVMAALGTIIFLFN